MLYFRDKSEIAVSDIVSSIVSGLSESETESKQKSGETRPSFIAYLFAFRWIPNTKLEIPNLKFEIPNQVKYPIASNPYLELCENQHFI